MGEVPTPLQSDSPRHLPAGDPMPSVTPLAAVPSTPFRPRHGLRGPHRQTLASQFLVEPEVKVLCRCHWQQARRHALAVLPVHRLEASGECPYVLRTTAKALAADMNVVRMNVRDYEVTEARGQALYFAGRSADVGA